MNFPAPSRWPVEGLLIKILQAIGTAPLEFTNNTQQELRPITSLTKSNYKLSECSCALARQKQRSICFCLDLFGSFCIKAKRTENQKADLFIFFLLLVQKKERKKSTPATIYSRCRTPWFSCSATVNWAKKLLSSTSTIIVICFLTRTFHNLVPFLYL